MSAIDGVRTSLCVSQLNRLVCIFPKCSSDFLSLSLSPSLIFFTFIFIFLLFSFSLSLSLFFHVHLTPLSLFFVFSLSLFFFTFILLLSLSLSLFPSLSLSFSQSFSISGKRRTHCSLVDSFHVLVKGRKKGFAPYSSSPSSRDIERHEYGVPVC